MVAMVLQCCKVITFNPKRRHKDAIICPEGAKKPETGRNHTHKPFKIKEVTMNINIKSIHFDATEKLEEFINKKVEKLAKTVGDDADVDIQLKIVKPQTAMNKEASIALPYQGKRLYAEKVADTFEDAVLQVVDSLKVQIEKIKNKA